MVMQSLCDVVESRSSAVARCVLAAMSVSTQHGHADTLTTDSLTDSQVQLAGVRGGGPSSLPPLHAAQREKGRSVNECSPESHHLLPPPLKSPLTRPRQRYPTTPALNFSNSD
ncbi:unnamed protein product [Pleuronectes platessa]|uniref:Uncharacterized protein n=1 Tax=Pleuronectes platessa TaxID=8262 RepID=A0A9N7TZF5_PLEPL|nr:unnamed protein product [Pleuronectes platessa]